MRWSLCVIDRRESLTNLKLLVRPGASRCGVAMIAR
jgi:hypothetical protein